jgi:hypothetical protein
MTQRTRLKIITCTACPFPVGIHGKRCRGCAERMCLACTRRAEQAGLLLCAFCESEYDAETIARYEENERGRLLQMDRLETR